MYISLSLLELSRIFCNSLCRSRLRKLCSSDLKRLRHSKYGTSTVFHPNCLKRRMRRAGSRCHSPLLPLLSESQVESPRELELELEELQESVSRVSIGSTSNLEPPPSRASRPSISSTWLNMKSPCKAGWSNSFSAILPQPMPLSSAHASRGPRKKSSGEPTITATFNNGIAKLISQTGVGCMMEISASLLWFCSTWRKASWIFCSKDWRSRCWVLAACSMQRTSLVTLWTPPKPSNKPEV